MLQIGKENYDANNKVKSWLPRKPEERQRWISLIPRDNIPDKKDTVVCERHWPVGYHKVTDYGKGRPRGPPSIFMCKTKFSPYDSSSTKRDEKISCWNSTYNSWWNHVIYRIRYDCKLWRFKEKPPYCWI